MRTPYADRTQFDEKAATLAAELHVDTEQAGQLLAHLSGYDDVAAVDYGAGDKSTWSSREELVARLLSSRPDMANDQAARVINRLALAVRDADIDHVASSPDAVPNMGG